MNEGWFNLGIKVKLGAWSRLSASPQVFVDELNRAHPKSRLKSSSSGGGRIDFEILKRTHRFWASGVMMP